MLGGRGGEGSDAEWGGRQQEEPSVPDIPVGSSASDDDLPF